MGAAAVNTARVGTGDGTGRLRLRNRRGQRVSRGCVERLIEFLGRPEPCKSGSQTGRSDCHSCEMFWRQAR